MLAGRTLRWTFAPLWLAGALLAACASSPQRSARGDLRLDTETAARLRHAASLGQGAGALAPAATQVVASSLGGYVPFPLTLLKNDNAVGEFERRLEECAELGRARGELLVLRQPLPDTPGVR